MVNVVPREPDCSVSRTVTTSGLLTCTSVKQRDQVGEPTWLGFRVVNHLDRKRQERVHLCKEKMTDEDLKFVTALPRIKHAEEKTEQPILLTGRRLNGPSSTTNR
jgi:hypothetical protein